MVRKVYTCLSGKEITFPVKVSGKVIYLTFSGPNNQYKTSIEEVQKAIEKTDLYKQGTIILTRQQGNVESTTTTTVEPKVYPDITEYQDAAEVLKKEHNVAHQSVRSPELILKKAQELNVSFPNLK